VLGAYVMLCEGEVWYAGVLFAEGHAAAWNSGQCVGSVAGVLCEMTTRADETDAAQAQGETSTKQWWGLLSLHSHST
jgi:hypothetical protein